MKAALVISQSACLLAVVFRGLPRYRLTLVYLAAAIPATAVCQPTSTWLHSWYPFLCAPIALFRLVAALEVCHRQTEGFTFWSRLMAGVFLLAGMFAGLAWVYSSGDLLHSLVQSRRLIQIFTGSVFLVLETFWLCMGGGWYRRADWIAVWFGLLAMSHATVSVLAGVGPFDPKVWEDFMVGSWGLEAVCYVGLTSQFLTPVRCVPPLNVSPGSPRADRAAPAANPESPR